MAYKKELYLRYDEGSTACLRKRYIVTNGKEKLIETTNSCGFPKDFQADYLIEKKYLKIED